MTRSVPVIKPPQQRQKAWRERNHQEAQSPLHTDSLRQQYLQDLQIKQPAKFALLLKLIDLAGAAPINIVNQGIRSIENALIVHQSSQEQVDR